ncbi:hypothetical protein BKA70DRAFT_1216397 [Coprinopsis sp. MPI-PUGE-AT-0042]|nr:hypothetical protein BKA70DRAFT_1216397 [Coprinopsis sp. MPI-PUGE-AT-0042]
MANLRHVDISRASESHFKQPESRKDKSSGWTVDSVIPDWLPSNWICPVLPTLARVLRPCTGNVSPTTASNLDRAGGQYSDLIILPIHRAARHAPSLLISRFDGQSLGKLAVFCGLRRIEQRVLTLKSNAHSNSESMDTLRLTLGFPMATLPASSLREALRPDSRARLTLTVTHTVVTRSQCRLRRSEYNTADGFLSPRTLEGEQLQSAKNNLFRLLHFRARCSKVRDADSGPT